MSNEVSGYFGKSFVSLSSECMEQLMSAQLKRSNYKRLACTVRLIDHRLDYSPSGIDEPAEDKRRHRKSNVSAILQTPPRESC